MALASLLLALAVGPTPIDLARSQGTLPLLEQAIVLEDPTESLTLEDVTQPRNAERFAPHPGVLRMGHGRSAYWVWFEVRPGATREWLVVMPAVDWVTLFTQSAHGWRTFETGRRTAFSTRIIRNEDIAVSLGETAVHGGRVLLRLRSADTVFTRPVLVPATSYASAIAQSRAGTGLYYGLLLAIIAVSLFAFQVTRDRAYLSYALFQLAMLLAQASMDQLTFQLLWPWAPGWATRSEIFFAGLAMVWAVAFARAFLGRQAIGRSLDRALGLTRIVGAALAAVIVLLPAPWLQEAGALLVLQSNTVLLAAGIVAWRRGSLNAPFYVAGFSSVLLASAALAGVALLVPAHTITGMLGLKIGSGLEGLILSLGLANRYRRIGLEKERMQAALLEERALAARTLETRIEERTRELAATVQELEAAQARLVAQGRLAALGHLVSGVAHEIGNPLNFALGGARVASARLAELEQRLPSGELGTTLAEARQGVTLVESGGTRIAKIVENLRGYLSRGRVASRRTDVTQALESTVMLMSERLERQKVQVRRRYESVPEVHVPPGELGQIFMNLLLNALHAMPEGGLLELGCERIGDQVVATVSDSGPGVPPEHRDAIFDAFFTTREEGTGLGLYISHQIAVSHGGTLELDDRFPGATFLLRLPIAAD